MIGHFIAFVCGLIVASGWWFAWAWYSAPYDCHEEDALQDMLFGDECGHYNSFDDCPDCRH